ncbi:hypothetical protein V6N11_072760 [Hibiscus sabdariffa]|uniref:Uncharacterized protein n=1 Tax=Hibiscus sabdariffa TaxID=183260 RepID=A0ABR2NE34_9ROSI
MEGATSLKASTLEAPELAACFSSTSNLKLPFAPSLYGHIATYIFNLSNLLIIDHVSIWYQSLIASSAFILSSSGDCGWLLQSSLALVTGVGAHGEYWN